MRKRPYPTKEAWQAYAAEYERAEQEDRICPECKMNIADEPGGLCIGCGNRKALAKEGE